MEKEEKNTALNLHKLQQQWRVVLMQNKAAELRDDMSVLSQTFERVLDCKDSIIRVTSQLQHHHQIYIFPKVCICIMCVCVCALFQSLVVDLSEREQQSELARSSHLRSMDSLLELHGCRLGELKMYFNTTLDELSSEFNTERYACMNTDPQETILSFGSFSKEDISRNVWYGQDFRVPVGLRHQPRWKSGMGGFASKQRKSERLGVVWLLTFFQISSFCVLHRGKLIQVWNDMSCAFQR